MVTPDNGALTHLVRHVGIVEVREIDETVNRNPNTRGTSVFHGRDLFGYCAARLASGIITYEQVGPAYPIDEIVCLPMPEPTIEDVASVATELRKRAADAARVYHGAVAGYSF